MQEISIKITKNKNTFLFFYYFIAFDQFSPQLKTILKTTTYTKITNIRYKNKIKNANLKFKILKNRYFISKKIAPHFEMLFSLK